MDGGTAMTTGPVWKGISPDDTPDDEQDRFSDVVGPIWDELEAYDNKIGKLYGNGPVQNEEVK
jgi:hypothetical protein